LPNKTGGILQKGIPLSASRNKSDNFHQPLTVSSGDIETNRNQNGKHPRDARLAYSVKDAAAVSSISRSKLYELMKAGFLGSVRIGGRRLIRHSDLMALLHSEAHR